MNPIIPKQLYISIANNISTVRDILDNIPPHLYNSVNKIVQSDDFNITIDLINPFYNTYLSQTKSLSSNSPYLDIIKALNNHVIRRGGYSSINEFLGEDFNIPDNWITMSGQAGFLINQIEIPVLIPGDGWLGATAEPDAVGNPGDFGYDAKAIARWDVVPYQTITDDFYVGIVAFSVNIGGIDRVEVAIDGGEWVRAFYGINSQTGVLEYFVKIKPINLNDGIHEVRAIVYPKIGIPRVLSGIVDGGTSFLNGECSLYINTDYNNTLPKDIRYVSTSGSDSNNGLTIDSPKLTIRGAKEAINTQLGNDVGGGVILCAAGSYTVGATENFFRAAATQWITVKPIDGVSKNEVVITGQGTADGLRVGKLKFENVTFTSQVSSVSFPSTYIWVDNCDINGSGLTNSIDFGSWTAKWFTDVSITNTHNGINSGYLARNVSCDGVGETGYRNVRTLINATVKNTERGDPEYHPDVFQLTQALPNIIWYNINAIENINGTFGIRIQPSALGVAIINANITMGTGSPYVWEMERPYVDILIKNGNFNGPWRYTGTISTQNVVFESCVFTNGQPTEREGVIFR